jgi:hypothetical protein
MKRFSFLAAAAMAAGMLLGAGEVPTRVNVTSNPSGASVIIDGIDRGTTPVPVFDLAPGRHHLKYRMAGYVERDRFFRVGEEPVVERNEVLVEETGILLVKTDPAGCSVIAGGVTLGTTPLLITSLPVKDVHDLTLRKAGYQDQVMRVKFDGRTPQVREEKLTLASGIVEIMSEPAGAEVFVNGISRGRSPVKVVGVPKGRALVKFRLDGFEEELRELAVSAGDEQTLSVVLKGLPGTLHLVSVPEGAWFYINDEPRGKSPVSVTGLNPGDYLVRAEKEGFGTVSRTLTLANGASLREEFRLSNVMGRVEVRTDPPGAQILFDSKIVGVTLPNGENSGYSQVFAIENVLEGEHTLVVRKDGYAETVRRATVKNSKTATANVRLRRVFAPDVEIVTARGSHRGVLVTDATTSESVVVEVSPGITRSFPRAEIRKINIIGPEKK